MGVFNLFYSSLCYVFLFCGEVYGNKYHYCTIFVQSLSAYITDC